MAVAKVQKQVSHTRKAVSIAPKVRPVSIPTKPAPSMGGGCACGPNCKCGGRRGGRR